ncbi:MAG: GNAT family N-acetyltransferase [Candidatus Neomarinimicrobiota bacterium]
MNYKIKTVDKSDFDFVLSLNQKTLPEVSSIDLVGMSYFLKNSSYFKIILHKNHPVGFCIGLMPGKDYSSENYIWINRRCNSFIYVDRIVINEKHRNKGIGSYLYTHLEETYCGKVENITCEVNILPYNKPSMNFHKKYGFKEIGQKDTENGKKRVAYMAYKLS